MFVRILIFWHSSSIKKGHLLYVSHSTYTDNTSLHRPYLDILKNKMTVPSSGQDLLVNVTHHTTIIITSLSCLRKKSSRTLSLHSKHLTNIKSKAQYVVYLQDVLHQQDCFSKNKRNSKWIELMLGYTYPLKSLSKLTNG